MQTAEASHSDDYFEYRFPFPIQLGSRQSALLPFLNKSIEAERVSIYKSGADRDHPLNGAWLKNNDELPLEAGPVTFFQSGKYAGETVLDYLSRGERRLVSYGVDYDIQAETRQSGRPETLAGVTVSRGVMVVRRETVQTTDYKFRNKGQENKTVILEHPHDSQRILKELKPEETSPGFYRFRIEIAPGQEIAFPVSETISRQQNYVIRTLDRANFELAFSGSEFPAALRSGIGDIIAQRQRLADLQAEKLPIDNSIKSIFTDQERLRENLKALGDRRQDRVLRQKYVAQLDGQEQQVTALRAKLGELTRQIAEQEALVAKMISDLTWN